MTLARSGRSAMNRRNAQNMCCECVIRGPLVEVLVQWIDQLICVLTPARISASSTPCLTDTIMLSCYVYLNLLRHRCAAVHKKLSLHVKPYQVTSCLDAQTLWVRWGQSLDFRSFQSSVFLSFRPKFQFSLFQSLVLVQIDHLDEISMKIFYPSNKRGTLRAWGFWSK